MEGDHPEIDVRAVHIDDALALHELDCSFETDRIYTLSVRGKLLQSETDPNASSALTFELQETPIDPPVYKNFREFESTLEDVETRLRNVEGGYVALAGGQVAGAALLKVEDWRAVARIEDIIVGRQYRRYGIGSLLLRCAADWARNRGCWAVVLEAQNINYPAIQFYLRNGMRIWSIHQYFYPPGPVEHEVALMMGKKLWSAP